MALQIKRKAPKPVLRKGDTIAPSQNPSKSNEQPAVAQPRQSKESTPPTESTNAAFGMMDIPNEERYKSVPQEEYMQKLERGELVFGVVPQTPTFKAIDDVVFDYCDGFRILFPKTDSNIPLRSYRILIKDEQYGTIVCNEKVESSDMKYITTIQKYFAHFGFTVVRLVNLPQDMANLIMARYKLNSIELDVIYDLCCVPEVTQEAVETDIFAKCYVYEEEEKPRYAQAIRDLLKYVHDNHTFHHSFDPKDKEVMIQFPISTIGDSVGWFSYMERFQEKTKCKLTCVMNPHIYCLFEKQYPNIEFIPPKETKNRKPYASYNMGLFFKANTTQQPYDFRYIGNGRTVSKIIDVDDTDIAPRVDLSAPRKIKEPYVVIAVNGSAYCKMWTHPTGWQTVIDHLKEIGYRIICIDRDRTVGNGVVVSHMPWGVEDDTGAKPLQERINMLKDCDFFIGVSSGLSWLAWCAKCPVVMISGFTNPYNEYYTPYRVINTFACHGCWNDETCDFDHYDYMWCPKHKNTPRAYECSKMITPEHVLNVIATIPAYQKMKAKYDAEHKEKKNPYLEKEIPMPEKAITPNPQPDQISVPAQDFSQAVINIK